MDKKTSGIWEHYVLCENETFVKCKNCNCQISRGGVGKSATTTPMINHLKRKHSDEYEVYQGKGNASRNRQPTIMESFQKCSKWDINDRRAKSIHYTIGEMIALDNLPYSFSTNEGFKRLMNQVAPQYNLPGRNYFSETIIPDIYNRLVKVVKEKLSSAEHISLTSDIWTCQHTNEGFISFTGHWLDNHFVHNHLVLNCKHFPGSHTSEAIKNTFFDMLHMWDMDISQVHVMVRDNGANIVKGCKEAGIVSVSCFIHTLQLCVMETMDSQRSISDLVAVCKRIVGHFNHSSVACSKLKDIQTELNMTPKKLVQDVPTRWNSTFYMVKSIQEQKRALTIYAADNNLEILTGNQWMLMESLLNLLEPLEEVTRRMSSNEAFISEVIPVITTLKKYLNTDIDMEMENSFFGVGTMKNILYEQILKRFDTIFKNKYYIIPTILEPRFKIAFFQKESTEYAKQVLINEYSSSEPEELSNKDSEDDNLPLATLRNVLKSDGDSKETKSKLWQCFDEIALCSTQQDMDNLKNKNSINEELNIYLNFPLIERTENPAVWWKNKTNDFPILSKIVKKFLTVPASSVYSERTFSEAGNIYRDSRNRLLPTNAEKLIFLHHNLPLLNFKY